MTEVRFYHMVQKRIEKALPEIVAKALERGYRVIIKSSSQERVEALDSVLWSYDPASFLPHGFARDGFEDQQPVFLTTADDNPNNAKVLMLTDGATSDMVGTFDLCCELFDGNDETAVGDARARWKLYKGQGFDLAYFQQNDEGRWEKKGV